jgi:hypothetical protein
LWNGSAESVFDLHTVLTALEPSFVDSYALGIAANGDVVGYASDGDHDYAVMWSLVPEPSTLVLGALSGIGFLCSRCDKSSSHHL